MLVSVSPKWEWVKQFETLTRCADTLEDISEDVKDPRRAKDKKVPVVGRLRATLDEASALATNPDFRAAAEALRTWTEVGAVPDVAAVFVAAAQALRIEARAVVRRRPDSERRVAVLYQLAMTAETSPGSALLEYRIKDDFDVDHLTAERWINAGKERGDLEVLGFRPETGRSIRITQQGLETLEGIVGSAEPGAPVREKQQKFGILDAPNLLDADIAKSDGPLGICAVFLDLDHFKKLNTQFTERKLDRTLVPEVHQTLASAAKDNGYCYAVGGDEFIFLLPNSTEAMGEAFVLAVLEIVRGKAFRVEGEEVRVTASAGLASTARFAPDEIADRANAALRAAKERGRNCLVVAGRADSKEVGTV